MSAEKLTFAQLLRARLVAQANLFSALTDHPTLVGSARERALSELLRGIVPRRLEVLTGAIALVPTGTTPHALAANQVDIMIVDTMDYPLLLREGDTAVALPEAVRAVVEVKSDLKKGDKFKEAMEQIGIIRRNTPASTTALFSYVSPTKPKTLRDWLEDVVKDRKKLENKPRNQRSHEENTQIEAYSPINMPDLIVAEKGAVAMKEESSLLTTGGSPQPPKYKFFIVEGKEPSAVALVEQIMVRITKGVLPQVGLGGSGGSTQLAGAFSSVAKFLNVSLIQAPKCPPLSLS